MKKLILKKGWLNKNIADAKLYQREHEKADKRYAQLKKKKPND